MNTRMTCQITFAIPFYSKPEYLHAAIASVLKQTRSDWQLIVCDDCGPVSGIREQIEAYDDPRIRYFRNEKNLGLGGNWNRCLELAETDLVNLLHSDDVLLPNYADTMIRAFERWPRATALFCRTQIIDPDGNPVFSFPDLVKKFLTQSESREFELSGEKGLNALLRGNFIMCPTLCFRKSALGPERFVPSMRFVLDLDMSTRILLKGGQLVGVPEICYAYRRHASSTSALGTADMTMFQEEVALYDSLNAEARSRGWKKAAATAKNKTMIKLKIGFYAAKDLALLNSRPGLSKLRYLASVR